MPTDIQFGTLEREGGVPQPENPLLDYAFLTPGLANSPGDESPIEVPSIDDSNFIPDDGPLYLSDDQKGTNYHTWYEICVSRTITYGLAGLSPSGDKTTRRTEIVRYGSPRCTYIIAWVAERELEQPRLPHWNFGDLNWVLLRQEITPECPSLHPAGDGFRFRVRGVYEYVLQDCPEDLDSIPVPTTAIVTVPGTAFAIPPGKFDSSILASVLTTTSGSLPELP